MPEPILLALILIPLLLGGVLFAVLRSQNRREPLQARLKSMMATAAVEAAPSLLSSGPSTQKTGGSGPLRMLRTLRTRLNTELLATGNRIGLLHLALAGFIAAAALLLFSLVLLGITPEKAAVLCGAAALATPVFLLRHSQRRYQNRFLDLFPDALDLIGTTRQRIGRAVKAGLPVLDAMEVATQAIPAPVGSEFRRTLDEVRIGVEITTALRHAAERVRVPEFRFYVVGIGLQNRTGGSLTDTLANLSHVIRRRKELRLKIRAFTAESKMSVMVLSALPFIAGGLQLLINYDLMVTLFTDPRGRFMVGLALASLVSGTAVMAYIIKRAMR